MKMSKLTKSTINELSMLRSSIEATPKLTKVERMNDADYLEFKNKCLRQIIKSGFRVYRSQSNKLLGIIKWTGGKETVERYTVLNGHGEQLFLFSTDEAGKNSYTDTGKTLTEFCEESIYGSDLYNNDTVDILATPMQFGDYQNWSLYELITSRKDSAIAYLTGYISEYSELDEDFVKAAKKFMTA